MNKISIIVPVYNVESYICKCVDSILVQSYKQIEIILVDDGSPDRCPEICDEYARKDKRIKVIHQENGGLSAARNSGIKVASGEYISFVDSDDYIDSDFIEQMYTCAEETNADIVCCGMSVINSNRTLISVPEDVNCYTNDRMKLLVQPHGVGDYYMNKFFRRSVLDEFELPEGKLYEDIYSMHILFERAHIVVWLNKKLYNYRINESGISHNIVLNPKFMDFVYANQCQYDFINSYFPEYKIFSLMKYAGAITHQAEVLMRKAKLKQRKKLFLTLTLLSRKIQMEVLNNKLCSLQLKYEINTVSYGYKKWKYYYLFRERVKRLHNHPSVQERLSKVLKWEFIPVAD